MQIEDMPKLYIDTILSSQEKIKKIRMTNEHYIVFCPFSWAVDDLGGDTICTICHTWMMTIATRHKHPCTALIDRHEVLERFWRSPTD
jgi:hypothetical protein